MRVTVDVLRAKGGSCQQIETFHREWPDGALVNLRNCRRAVELGLYLDWPARHLLSAGQRAVSGEACASAGKVCDEACESAGKVCNEAACRAFCAAVKGG